jgi:hypothetical protein
MLTEGFFQPIHKGYKSRGLRPVKGQKSYFWPVKIRISA